MAGLVCKIELNKERGITLTVENEEGKTTQTAVFDGTAITITCKGEEETSIIEQVADTITVTVKNFTVNATEIALNSEEGTTLKATKTMTLESTEDMTIESKAAMAVKATKDVDLEGANVNVKSASGDVKLDAAMVLDGKSGTDLKLEGLSFAATGTTGVEVKGLEVKLTADATAELKGAMTTVEGQILALKGSVVKVGS